MTVRAIRLENFMAFKDTAWVELRPITLVFGRNSSGKSAIIRALRLLHQSLDRGTRTQPLAFVVEGGLDQGDFKSTINRRPKEADEDKERYTWKRIMSFAFRCRLTATRDILQARIRRAGRETDGAQDAASPETDLFDFKVSFGWDEKDQRVKLVGVYILGPAFIDTPDAPVLLAMERDKENLSDESWNWLEPWYFWGALVENYEGNTSGSPFRNAFVELTSGWLPTLVVSDAVQQKDGQGNLDDFGLCRSVLDELTHLVQTFLGSVRYLPPVRPEAQRRYIVDQQRSITYGEGLTQLLLGDMSEGEPESIDRWIRHLGLGGKLVVEVVTSPLGGIARVEVQEEIESQTESASGDAVINLQDTGYGASQVLPIVAQGVLDHSNPFVVVEQPELHLHPQAQAQLADLFIASTKDTEHGTVFWLETHSESLILRIRRRLAETQAGLLKSEEAVFRLSPKRLAAYFVERRSYISYLNRIEYDGWGRYIYQPSGFVDFFGNDFDELLALDEARMNMSQEENLTWDS